MFMDQMILPGLEEMNTLTCNFFDANRGMIKTGLWLCSVGGWVGVYM